MWCASTRAPVDSAWITLTILRLRIDVHGNELVGAVPEPIYDERPNLNEILLTFNQLGNVRRVAGLIAGYGFVAF
jgi:hypothetical protein